MKNQKIKPFQIDNVEKDRHFVTALARGLEVLRAFRPGEGAVGNTEIATRTGLPKSTVSRLTSTLVQLGYLIHREDEARYEPSPAVLTLGYTFLANSRLRLLAAPAMREMARNTGYSLAMGARHKLNMLYVEAARGAKASTLVLEVGSYIPLAKTSMGRAFLAGMVDVERDFVMDSIKHHSGAEWPEIKKGIEESLIHYEEKGFCVSFGDWQRATNAVGVPIRDQANGDLMAINCGCSAYLATPEELIEEMGPQLVSLARGVEIMCGQG